MDVFDFAIKSGCLVKPCLFLCFNCFARNIGKFNFFQQNMKINKTNQLLQIKRFTPFFYSVISGDVLYETTFVTKTFEILATVVLVHRHNAWIKTVMVYIVDSYKILSNILSFITIDLGYYLLYSQICSSQGR